MARRIPYPAHSWSWQHKTLLNMKGHFPSPKRNWTGSYYASDWDIPNPTDEIEILDRQQLRHPIETLKSVIKVDELKEAMEVIKKYMSPTRSNAMWWNLTNRTRQNEDVYLGASPRGSLALFRTGQVAAALDGT